MSHNKELTALLNDVRQEAESAQGEEALRPIFTKLKEFKTRSGAIKYDNSGKWIALCIFAAVGLLTVLVYFSVPGVMGLVSERLGDAVFFIIGGYAIIPVGVLIAIGFSNSEIDSISESIFWKDVCLDNQLSEINISGQEKSLYHRFCADFSDFRGRGDEDQYVKHMVRGTYHGGVETKLSYDYYVFHYVVVTYVPTSETYTDSKGNTHTRIVMKRVETTHYRYGIMTDFPEAKGIAAVSGGGSWDYPVKWDPTSTEFSSTFEAYSDNQMAAAKFWKPAVVLAAVELAKHFSDPNIEINRTGKLCISFADSDVLELDREFSIADPEEFEKEIFSRLELPKPKALMQFVEIARKHNDRNF